MDMKYSKQKIASMVRESEPKQNAFLASMLLNCVVYGAIGDQRLLIPGACYWLDRKDCISNEVK